MKCPSAWWAADHPDHNQGEQGKFVAVQQAYENLIKNKGMEVLPHNEDSWNFHDWYGCRPLFMVNP